MAISKTCRGTSASFHCFLKTANCSCTCVRLHYACRDRWSFHLQPLIIYCNSLTTMTKTRDFRIRVTNNHVHPCSIFLHTSHRMTAPCLRPVARVVPTGCDSGGRSLALDVVGRYASEEGTHLVVFTHGIHQFSQFTTLVSFFLNRFLFFLLKAQGRIVKTARLAEQRQVSVLCLGALNKAEWMNHGAST